MYICSLLLLDSCNQVSGSLSDFLLTPLSPTASQGSPSFCVGSLEEDSPFPSFAQVNPLLGKQPKGIYLHELYCLFFLEIPLWGRDKTYRLVFIDCNNMEDFLKKEVRGFSLGYYPRLNKEGGQE